VKALSRATRRHPPGCGPCRQIAPALEELAKDYDGKLTIAKLNIDENPNAAMRFGVRSIPTLILFNDGKAAAMQVGAVPKGRLVDWINTNVA